MSIDKLILACIGSAFVGVSISYADFYLFHFFIIIVSIFGLYSLKQNNYKLQINILYIKYVGTLYVIFFWYLLSLFWTPSLELGLKYIFYLFCGLFVCFAIIVYSSKIEKLDKIFYLLATLIFFEITIAILESFTSFRMPISSYSAQAITFGKEPVNFSETSTISMLSNFQPPTGFRWNTNDLAICMALSLPFFLCSKKFLVQFLGVLLVSTLVIMTSSRAVFLALILIYTLYIILIKKRLGTLVFVWFISLIFIFGIYQFRDSENPRINEVANSIEAAMLYLSGQVDVGGSLEWRTELIKNGLTAFYNTNFLGLGAGGTVANQEIIGPVAQRFTSMHNFWIELLVEGGLFVGIIIVLWIFRIIYDLFKISKNDENKTIQYYSQSLFLSMFAFIPAAIAASSTIYFFPMWIMFGAAISVIFISKSIAQ